MQKKWDVLVAGSGPAGMAAAYAAARNGARVLLVEKDGFVGGMATSGLINSWRGTASSGFFERMQRISVRAWGQLIYDPEQAAELFRQMIEEYDIQVLSQATVCGVRVSDKTVINSVQVLTRQGIVDYQARCCIDATGDGDLAALAGVPFDTNDAEAGDPTVFLMVQLGGIDTRNNRSFSREQFESLIPLLKDAADRGEIAPLVGPLTVVPGVRGGTGMMKIIMDAPFLATDAQDVVRAELACRAQVMPLIAFLKKNMPGYANCYLIRTASRVGLMQGRRIRGRYTVTLSDIEQGRTFSDWVVTRACPPQPAGSDLPCLPFTLPYGCLQPRKIRNLLLAGRCISGTREAYERYQTMPICMATGQAAGTAAAMAAAHHGRVRKVDVQALQDRLLQQGVAPPRPQFVLQGISPILTDSPPQSALHPEESPDDAIPVIPADAGRSLRPEAVAGIQEEQDPEEEPQCEQTAADEGTESPEGVPVLTFNLEEMPDFEELQAGEPEADEEEAADREQAEPEAAQPAPESSPIRIQPQKGFRSDYALLIEQILSEETAPARKPYSFGASETAMDDAPLPSLREPEITMEDRIEPLESEPHESAESGEVSGDTGQWEQEPEQEPVPTEPETEQPEDEEEPPASETEIQAVECAPPAVEAAGEESLEEAAPPELPSWEEIPEELPDQDEEIETVLTAEGEAPPEQATVEDPDEFDDSDISESHGPIWVECAVQGDDDDGDENEFEQDDEDEDIEDDEDDEDGDALPVEAGEQAGGDDLEAGEMTEEETVPQFVIMEAESFTEEPLQMEAPSPESVETDSGDAAPEDQELPAQEDGDEAIPQEPAREEEEVHPQSSSGRMFTYYRKNPDDNPAAWNRFASEVWSEWLGDGDKSKSKGVDREPAAPPPPKSEEPPQNYATLRRDGKSPLDIDVQDLL